MKLIMDWFHPICSHPTQHIFSKIFHTVTYKIISVPAANLDNSKSKQAIRILIFLQFSL